MAHIFGWSIVTCSFAAGPAGEQVRTGVEMFKEGALHAHELLDMLVAASGRLTVVRAMAPFMPCFDEVGHRA